MCGIIGYIGKRDSLDVIIKGLERLEYRGYDSAGVALLNKSELKIIKRKGKVEELKQEVAKEKGQNFEALLGIGHTRWATHGVPNDINSHPHYSGNKEIAIVHNGIIENYATIKEELVRKGHSFQTQTDTEVLAHLIEDIQKEKNLKIEEAVLAALNLAEGAYAIAVIDKKENDKIIAARKSSPLVIGIGENECFIASDISPISEYTKNIIYLGDSELAVVKLDKEGVIIKKVSETNETVTPIIKTIDIELEAIEKGGYEHFMLKEIYQQPQTLRDTMRGRLNASEGWIRVGGLEESGTKLDTLNRVVITACGTSYFSGLIGEYLLENLARINTEVEYASEFRYRNPVISERDLVIAISQSGETADTLAAIELAKQYDAHLYGIVNVVGSSIARETGIGSYLHAGPEIGVASTKAFTSQVALLTMIAITLGRRYKVLGDDQFKQLIDELDKIPEKIEMILEGGEQFKKLAEEIAQHSNALFLGRGYNYPVAMEGALKLKELSYIHAEGYPAAEMKHGPIALIDEKMPVVIVATNPSAYEKIVNNIQEVKARGGKVFAITTSESGEIAKLADISIEIPTTLDPLSPLLSSIPMQLIAYYAAVAKGHDVDRPRNLAKSVTVE